MYVGETERSLMKNEHQVDIIKDGPSLLYKHFGVADMRVQILEKMYQSSESPVNTRLYQRL